jgi:hypothetical protein
MENANASRFGSNILSLLAGVSALLRAKLEATLG